MKFYKAHAWYVAENGEKREITVRAKRPKAAAAKAAEWLRTAIHPLMLHNPEEYGLTLAKANTEIASVHCYPWATLHYNDTSFTKLFETLAAATGKRTLNTTNAQTPQY